MAPPSKKQKAQPLPSVPAETSEQSPPHQENQSVPPTTVGDPATLSQFVANQTVSDSNLSATPKSQSPGQNKAVPAAAPTVAWSSSSSKEECTTAWAPVQTPLVAPVQPPLMAPDIIPSTSAAANPWLLIQSMSRSIMQFAQSGNWPTPPLALPPASATEQGGGGPQVGQEVALLPPQVPMQPAGDVTGGEDGSGDDQPASSRPRKKARKSSHGPRRRTESSSSSSEYSSDDDSLHAKGVYWSHRAGIPSLPKGLARRRDSSLGFSEKHPPCSPLSGSESVQDPPGGYLPRELKQRALDGHFVDIFAFASLEGFLGVTGENGTERSFDNWLRGFGGYATLISAAYPLRSWQLWAHFGNVLQARAIAGDAAAISYDEEFRRCASHSENARWDVIHSRAWTLLVQTFAKPQNVAKPQNAPKPQNAAKLQNAALKKRTNAKTGQLGLCWDFNKGKCQRAKCKFAHVCKTCFGPHTVSSCPLRKGPQPF